MRENISHTPYGVTKFVGKTFSSDLRKLTAVSKSLSKFKNKYSGIEKIIWYIETSRMRNLHLHKKIQFSTVAKKLTFQYRWHWKRGSVPPCGRGSYHKIPAPYFVYFTLILYTWFRCINKIRQSCECWAVGP